MEDSPCKPLPTAVSKKDVVKMYLSTIPEKLISQWVRDIQRENRRGYFSKFSKNLTLKEWTEFVHAFGPPPGYSDTFKDGETVWEKFSRIKQNHQ